MKKIILLFVILCAASLFALADNPHITALAELVDVMLSSPVDGQVLTFDGASGKWQNKAPQSLIVAKQQFLNQSTNIVAATLFTPSVDGDYRISEYGESNTTANISIYTMFSWTNDFGQIGTDNGRGITTTPMPPICCGGADSTNIIVVHAKANTPITLDTCTKPLGGTLSCGPSGSFSPSFFNVFVEIEKLD